jgi:hypothetical protein
VVDRLLSFFGGGGGRFLGTVVADGAAVGALVPVALWFLHHKEEVAVCFSYGQLATFGLFCFAIVKVAHYTAPRESFGSRGPLA